MSLPDIPKSSFEWPSLCKYNESEVESYGQACYEKALLDAMNATLPFGKTGAVIAAAIRSLK